jgi:hypothetical protein
VIAQQLPPLLSWIFGGGRISRVERVVAYYAGDFPEGDREYVAVMRQLAEHPAAARVAAGLEAVPFNCFGFGLFPPGRVGDPDSPCLSLWYDDPYPLYWVQLRRRWDRDILTCNQPAGPEEAWATATEVVPRLWEEAVRFPDSGTRVPIEWLEQISPITSFADEAGQQGTPKQPLPQTPPHDSLLRWFRSLVRRCC